MRKNRRNKNNSWNYKSGENKNKKENKRGLWKEKEAIEKEIPRKMKKNGMKDTERKKKDEIEMIKFNK